MFALFKPHNSDSFDAYNEYGIYEKFPMSIHENPLSTDPRSMIDPRYYKTKNTGNSKSGCPNDPTTHFFSRLGELTRQLQHGVDPRDNPPPSSRSDGV